MTAFDESVVEQAALAWLESVGWQVRNGAEIAPGEPAAQREGYGQSARATQRRELLSPLITGDRRIAGAENFVRRAV